MEQVGANEEEAPTDEKQNQQTEVDPKIYKAIWNQLEHIADEVDAEAEVKPSLKTLTVDEVTVDKLVAAKQVGVSIDGCASHNVYYSATVPEGVVEKEVGLAHGTKKGYIRNDDIISLMKACRKSKGQ